MYPYVLTSKSGSDFFFSYSKFIIKAVIGMNHLNSNFQMQHSILFSFHDLFTLHLMLSTTDILVEMITHKAI